MDMESQLEDMIGYTIKVCQMDTAKEYIRFITNDDHIFLYEVYGDCCSSTWIEHITGIDFLLQGKISKIDNKNIGQKWLEKNMHNDDNENLYRQYYMTTIYTHRGQCDIEYRNDSNGFYGGDLESKNISYYSHLVFNDITQDF